jgi:hypothetical protein
MASEWQVVLGFDFTSIWTAEVQLFSPGVRHMTVAAVYDRFGEVLSKAAKDMDWDIWTVCT